MISTMVRTLSRVPISLRGLAVCVACEECFELGDPTWSAVYREQGSAGRGKELLGYVIEQPIYADDHDVDRRYYFNLKGALLGDEYCGE